MVMSWGVAGAGQGVPMQLRSEHAAQLLILHLLYAVFAEPGVCVDEQVFWQVMSP
jgi:hypothetical protein